MSATGSARPKNKHGQYFTPRSVADLMVSMASGDKRGRVLEPSSGEGVFLDALVAAGYEQIAAIEIDPELAHHEVVSVRQESFVSADLDPGFSLIIGNPPYIRWRNLEDEARTELEGDALWSKHFNSLSDYLTIFVARSVELLEEGGELIFITPSFWMHTMHSANLREFMLERGCVTEVVYFGEAAVFPGVGSSIIIFKYVKGACPSTTRLVRYVGARSSIPLDGVTFDEFVASDHVEVDEIPAFESKKPWVLAPAETQQRLNSLEDACRVATSKPSAQGSLMQDEMVSRLGDLADIANGMVSGLDAAFRIPPDLDLNESESNASIPVAKGFALSPFLVSELIPYIFVAPGLSEREFERAYPSFAGILAPHRERLESRYAYGRDLKYWEWAFLRSYDFFVRTSNLIFVPCKERLSNKDFLRFALAPEGSFPTQDVTAIGLKAGVKESPLYVLAALNFPDLYEWVRYKGLMKGEVAEFSEKPLSQMPVKRIDWSDQTEVDAHNRIVETTRMLISTGDTSLRDEIAVRMRMLLFG